jgi:probable F420-dependent oxidoreductase
MKFGVSANFPWMGPPITELARAIEAAGFESMWTGEHIIIPVEIADPHRYGVPLPDNYRHMPDLFVALTAAAVATTKLVVGMDICLVTQRHPLITAKAVATLDRICGGRLVFGVGHGWIAEESEIFGVPFKDRVRRATETVKALKTLWREEEPSFAGEFVAFPPVYSYPKPLQRPNPPVLIGSGNEKTNNTPILKRVAAIGDGWLPAFLSPAQMREQLAELKVYCDEAGRDFSAMDITLLLPASSLGLGEKAPWAVDLDVSDPQQVVGEYEEAGVGRIIIGLDDMTDRRAFGRIEDAARGLGLV